MKKELTPYLWIVFFVIFMTTSLFSEYNYEQGRINTQLKEHMRALTELKGSVDVMRTSIEKLRTKIKEADVNSNLKQIKRETKVLDSRLRIIQTKTTKIQTQKISRPKVGETDCKKYLDVILGQMLVIQAHSEQLTIIIMIINEFQNQYAEIQNQYPGLGELEGQDREEARAILDQTILELDKQLEELQRVFVEIRDEIATGRKNIIKYEAVYAVCIKKNSLSPKEIRDYEVKFDKIEIEIIKK